MVKLNPTKLSSRSNSTQTENHEGAPSYRPESADFYLFKLTINNLVQPTFYESGSEQLQKLVDAFEKAADQDPEYPLQLAVYARQRMYLRDVPQILLVLASFHKDCQPYVRGYAPKIMERADELSTVLATKNMLYGYDQTVPKPLKDALASGLLRQSTRSLAKYEGVNHDVSLRDVANVSHPKPETAEQQARMEAIVYGRKDDHPEVPKISEYVSEKQTQQTRSDAGRGEMTEREAYLKSMESAGIHEVVKNLRGMLEAGLSGEEIFDAAGTDRDNWPEWVSNAKIYPFRFMRAYEAIHSAYISDPVVDEYLERAVDASAENLPGEYANTLVAADLSGSMRRAVSDANHGGTNGPAASEIASLMAGVLQKRGATVMAFADSAEFVSPPHAETPVLERKRQIEQASVGGSTNTWKVFARLVDQNASYDKIIVLTDQQDWDSTGIRQTETVKSHFDAYLNSVNPETNLYMVDLQNYGTLSMPQGYRNVSQLQGWTEDIFDYIEMESNADTLMSEIRSIEPASPADS